MIESSGKDNPASNFSAYEEYLNLKIVFLEKFNNKDLFLEEGDYSYSFQIEIPNNLPSSLIIFYNLKYIFLIYLFNNLI